MMNNSLEERLLTSTQQVASVILKRLREGKIYDLGDPSILNRHIYYAVWFDDPSQVPLFT
jgi:hypothetical protein